MKALVKGRIIEVVPARTDDQLLYKCFHRYSNTLLRSSNGKPIPKDLVKKIYGRQIKLKF